ncbi:hypothetical protein SEVIR_6G177500v4 [Setaria viridis]|uniref:Uncharacterized protein n=1 Tax=Setaria viridis TaxID=4556 RepID=A0A4U6UAU9_SETVI|nr:hypothetical protein SEVIR_6G177500v2 [Setaria viridis]
MDVPFFVAFSAILLVGRYLPFALPANARAALADDGTAAPPARAAKCAISVAVAGLVLLVSVQCGSSAGSGGGHGHQPQPRQCPAVEARALWLNSAALFLGTLLLGAGSVALHPRAPPIVVVAVDHLTRVTETIAITAFAHDLCIFFKVSKV